MTKYHTIVDFRTENECHQTIPLSEEFRLIIISKLDDGANYETGSIPRGVKHKVAMELLVDKNSVSRAWES